ncbi:MAG TPA: CBS domain-containing protein [Steroidobacteraceae bacterium]|nr:CBS domain-containing protein [Steroidobacteraceae bacterium]
MCVGDICRRDVVTIAPDSSLCEAARLMREQHVGMLVVVEPIASGTGCSVKGVITDRDIVITVVGREADPKGLKVVDIMTRNPLIAVESQPISAVLRLMRTIGVRRVPVVNNRYVLVGVMAIDDVLEHMSEQLTSISGAIRDEQGRERVMRP